MRTPILLAFVAAGALAASGCSKSSGTDNTTVVETNVSTDTTAVPASEATNDTTAVTSDNASGNATDADANEGDPHTSSGGRDTGG